MSATQVRAGQVLDGTLTDADIAAANKDGVVGLACLRTLGTGAQQAAAGNDARFITNIDPHQRIWRSILPSSGTLLLISGTIYSVYLGRVVQSLTPKFVELLVTTAGAGTQNAEVALASSPSAPNKAAQTLTKLTSSATLGVLTAANTVVRNTSALVTAVAAGTHLWACIRTAMATTQPTLRALADDWGQGNVLVTTGQAAITGLASWTGSIVATPGLIPCPELRVTLD